MHLLWILMVYTVMQAIIMVIKFEFSCGTGNQIVVSLVLHDMTRI